MSTAQKNKSNRDLTNLSRRNLLKAVSAASALGVTRMAQSTTHTKNQTRLTVNMAGYDYDRVSGPQTRAVTEVGLHPFMLAYANDGFRDYTLLPIFPLRTFRHKSIFIRTDRGIERPEDLRGKKIATPGYSSTSLTWIRGILQDEYGVTPEDVQWIVS